MRMTVIESNSALSAVRETPACEQIRALVLDAVSSPATKRAYGKALDEFLAWCQREQPADGLSKAIVQRYRAALENRGLGASSVNIRMAAVRKLATEAADNGLLDAETARAIRSVHGVKMHGTRIGTWLSREQAQELLNAPDRETLKGTRDVALLAVLLGAGLRRSEVTALCVEDLQQREGRWVIMDIIGKGGRVRSVPIARGSRPRSTGG